VNKLRRGAGDEFAGEGILAVTKAPLQSGVANVAGGSPISRLMGVLADAAYILAEMGVRVESSASEATASASLAASISSIRCAARAPSSPRWAAKSPAPLWPAAQRFIQDRGLNEFFADGTQDAGLIMQGGLYNALLRATERLGMVNAYGRSHPPLFVMNAAYPAVDSELIRFCAGKRAVLLVGEGQPNFIEQGIASTT
jgi:TPP-dependent indolepyruvate ferredoxin oxidoreductase alpha subunit